MRRGAHRRAGFLAAPAGLADAVAPLAQEVDQVPEHGRVVVAAPHERNQCTRVDVDNPQSDSFGAPYR